MDVVKGAHNFQQTSFVNLSGLGGHQGKKSSNNLELHLLIAFGSAFAYLVYDGINQAPRQCAIALGFLILRVDAVVWMVTIE